MTKDQLNALDCSHCRHARNAKCARGSVLHWQFYERKFTDDDFCGPAGIYYQIAEKLT